MTRTPARFPEAGAREGESTLLLLLTLNSALPPLSPPERTALARLNYCE